MTERRALVKWNTTNMRLAVLWLAGLIPLLIQVAATRESHCVAGTTESWEAKIKAFGVELASQDNDLQQSRELEVFLTFWDTNPHNITLPGRFFRVSISTAMLPPYLRNHDHIAESEAEEVRVLCDTARPHRSGNCWIHPLLISFDNGDDRCFDVLLPTYREAVKCLSEEDYQMARQASLLFSI